MTGVQTCALPIYTDAGRQVLGGGGIQPDVVVEPQPPSRLMYVLEGSGILTTFAGEYIQVHEIDERFAVTPGILDQLKVFLSQRDIQPGIAEWLRDRDLIQSKLRQEIVNLKFGVAQGDRIEMQRDPLVRRALEALR